jgi:amylosucrase
MDWAVAARRRDPGSLEGRVFTALAALASTRRELLALRSGGSTQILPAGNPAVLAYRRVHPRSAPFLAVTNFSDYPQSIDAGLTGRAGLHQPRQVRATTVDPVLRAGRIVLPPWGFGWLSGGP